MTEEFTFPVISVDARRLRSADWNASSRFITAESIALKNLIRSSSSGVSRNVCAAYPSSIFRGIFLHRFDCLSFLKAESWLWPYSELRVDKVYFQKVGDMSPAHFTTNRRP